ncbi:MAG: protein kinase [Ardenticatenaceae bacterium]|nr:protein kinase [Ardenticatenaceae bacterium]
MTPNYIDRYEIRGEIGRGGMATVLKGYDPRFKRDVAIKLLPREFLHDPQFRARFQREAQTIAALEHPAIVPVYDFGDADGQLYLVMRLMTGGSLADRLEKGPLSITETARILERLAPALDSAHTLGIIHRDLKPANILFDQWNNPYLSDFGIAKLVAGSSTALTATGGLVGTPAYMSPEQVRGVDELDGRSDIYAMGVILFQMLTGKLPYNANTPIGLAFMHVTAPIPNILDIDSSLPEAYQTVIGQAMAKEREARPRTTAALADTISGLALEKDKSVTILDSDARETIVDPYPDKIETEQLEVEQPKTHHTMDLPLTALERELYLEKQGREIPERGLNAGALPQPVARVEKSIVRRIPAWGWAVIGLLSIALIYGMSLLGNGNDIDSEVTPTTTSPVVIVEEPTLTPSKTIAPSSTPTATNTSTLEPTEQPTETPTLRPTNTATLTPKPTDTVTNTPRPTNTPQPINTATPASVLFEIVVRSGSCSSRLFYVDEKSVFIPGRKTFEFPNEVKVVNISAGFVPAGSYWLRACSEDGSNCTQPILPVELNQDTVSYSSSGWVYTYRIDDYGHKCE